MPEPHEPFLAAELEEMQPPPERPRWRRRALWGLLALLLSVGLLAVFWGLLQDLGVPTRFGTLPR